MKKETHFQGCKKPTRCFKCNSRKITVILTKDRFWKVTCNCYSEAMYL